MKKWIIAAAIVLLLAIVAVAVVLLVQKNDTPPEKTETVSIAEDCWQHVTDLNVVEQDDGTAEVTLTAPDYVLLVKLLVDENNNTVTGELIKKAVKSNPEMVKEYSFTASSSAEDNVRKVLMEQISYELVAFTLEEMNG